MNLFIASFRFNKPITQLYRSVLPYIGLLGLALIIVTYVPALSTWLPSLVETNAVDLGAPGEPMDDDGAFDLDSLEGDDDSFDLDALEGGDELDLDALEGGETLDLDALEGGGRRAGPRRAGRRWTKRLDLDALGRRHQPKRRPRGRW